MCTFTYATPTFINEVLYSGKVWWGISLAKLVNLAKLQVICQLKPTKPMGRPVNHRHSPNYSSPKLLDAQFAKLFPHQTFPLYGTPYCYLSTTALNDYYSESMPYTALAYSYWVSTHDAYQCHCHVQ